MWRSFFLAIGATLLLFGLQGMALEKVVLRMKGDPPPKASPWDNEPKVAPSVELKPPPWAPYSLLSSGVITCLYSFTLPKKFKGG
mgnify:CR=1 FL=1